MTNKPENLFTSICSTKSQIQQYECAVILFNKFLHNYITIDGCLWQEIKYLHNLGIETIGSCCGKHIDCNKQASPYIQVKNEFIEKMEELGYIKQMNNFGAIYFEPKTVIKKAGNNEP